MNSGKMTLLSMSSRTSVDRAPARSSGGHEFDGFLSGTRGLSLSHARVKNFVYTKVHKPVFRNWFALFR